jgi:hypothetical protein
MLPVSPLSVLYCDVISHALSMMVLIAIPRLLELRLYKE